MKREVPDVFRPYVEEPAFSEDGMPRVTACMWREAGDDSWRTGTIDFPDGQTGDPDGASYLFQLLVDRSPKAVRTLEGQPPPLEVLAHAGLREADPCGILYVLHTGIQWEYLPQELGFGSGMTCWRRLRNWNEAGVWQRLHEVLLAELNAASRLDWSRCVVDSSYVRSPKGAAHRPVAGRPGASRL